MNSAPRRRTILSSVTVVLITTWLGLGMFALRQVARVMAAAEPVTRVHFNLGLSGVDPRAPNEWTNEHCGKCHQSEYQQWVVSRHAKAGTTHNYKVEFLRDEGGRGQHCVNCHTPVSPTPHLFPTEEPPGIDEAYDSKADWVQNGVDCLTCHVRDGKVLVTKHSEKSAAAHPIRVAPELGSVEFCAGCHQFNFKSHVQPDGYIGHLQQASFDEFLDVRARGEGEERCHDCHMPGGHHGMPGSYDEDMLSSAVDLKVEATWQPRQQAVLIEAHALGGHVGHRIPGGEIFRFLTLQTSLVDANGQQVTPKSAGSRRPPNGTTLVRHFPQVEELRRQMLRGPNSTVENERTDTRLWPGEIRTYRYSIPLDPEQVAEPLTARVELWYHLMPEWKARVLNHPLDSMKWMVKSTETKLPAID